ncbi:type II toxin-antitoxin system RelE/ParE family toxin [Rhizobium terrae]|uniref:type II toxin-antitoxin system RelE/ParE family toxin n=1 Tax=Rhizobium terrae TaxID=2171756 RepID=UPI000E3EDE93|nr:type II toxin-antitoxin system RelE/ParE family toxin [Rhizobium terrae]
MKFVFLPEAENDIERLFDFLMNQGNALAAQKAMLAIDEGIQMLLETPYIGIRMEGRTDYRQLFVPFGKSAYVLRYRIHEEADTLVVVRIWHGRENRV